MSYHAEYSCLFCVLVTSDYADIVWSSEGTGECITPITPWKWFKNSLNFITLRFQGDLLMHRLPCWKPEAELALCMCGFLWFFRNHD